ncbi:hypothetical protein RHO12_06520 [Orbus sturtevantii]|uniref:hypothetical protein n=1 Tax=Orbus sturtevantii TaxID=3074109 RepID=UPI00370D4C2C
MKKIIIIISILILTGCGVYLPFNDRLSYQSLKQIKSDINLKDKPTINIIWDPNDFPQRVDVQGASGFINAGSRFRIPTGVGLSSRIEEAVATYANISDKGKSLIIIVDSAKTKFTTSFTNIDTAQVNLSLTFNLDGKSWSKDFFAQTHEGGIRDATKVSVLESAWDLVALDVAKNIANYL